MRHRSPILASLACAVAIVASAATLAGQYSLTVNKDRLINSDKEPQNWLLMNGDYGSLRYSRLTQINRDNVKNLRMVWAMALSGMQDVGQNGPENEINPLIDRTRAEARPPGATTRAGPMVDRRPRASRARAPRYDRPARTPPAYRA